MTEKNNKSGLLPAWKPGTSGNPKGKKHGTANIRTRIGRIMALTAEEMEENGTYPKEFITAIRDMYGSKSVADALVMKMVSNALLKVDSEKGINDLLDRYEGKPKQAGDMDPEGEDIPEESLNDLTDKKALQIYQKMMKNVDVVIEKTKEAENAD